MKILVSGGAGFIGSAIVDAYTAKGHDVTVVDDLSSGHKTNIHPKAQVKLMDVRDPNISTLFEKNKFDVVNHHAAQMDVRKSVQDPFFDASVNILGTLRLLDCCREYGVRKFIFSSSGGTIYGECETPASEDTLSRPVSPYGISKATAESYIRFFGVQYKLPYTILRYGNVYGPRQDPHGEAGVVAIFAGKLLAKEVVTIFGTGNQERDYVFVGDVVDANIAALTLGNNETFNIGTGKPTSVNTLLKEMQSILTNKVKPRYAAAREGELERSVLNAARAEKILNWKNSYTLSQGLTKTLDYFRISLKKQLAENS